MLSQDCIHLTGVRCYGYTGALPEEQVLGQWFEVDATLWVEVALPGKTDRLADALDYRYAVAAIRDTVGTARFALIEKLVTVIADQLLAEARVQQVRVKLTKLAAPIPEFSGQIAIEIVRSRDPRPPLPQAAAAAQPVAEPLAALGQQKAEKLDASRAPAPADPRIRAIYTDGACSGNPGPGGWGVVVYFRDGSAHELGGADPATTNNRMELQAAVAALEFVRAHPQDEPITLYTDSEYLKNGITRWAKGWKQKGWKTAEGKPVKNEDLWRQLDSLHSSYPLSWQYVRGHQGDVGNERADAIATAFAQQRSLKLVQATSRGPC